MIKRYLYKGNTYYIESIAKMKNPSTGEWKEAVIYIQEHTGNRYVREMNDFYNKFKEIF